MQLSLVRSAGYEKCFLCCKIIYLMAIRASDLGVTLHTLNFHSFDHRHSLTHDRYQRQHCKNLRGRRFRTSPSYQCAGFGIIASWLPWLPGVTSFYDVVPGGLGPAAYMYEYVRHSTCYPYNSLTNLHSVATYEIGIFFVGIPIFERYWTMPSGLGHRLSWRPIVRPVCSSHNHN